MNVPRIGVSHVNNLLVSGMARMFAVVGRGRVETLMFNEAVAPSNRNTESGLAHSANCGAPEHWNESSPVNPFCDRTWSAKFAVSPALIVIGVFFVVRLKSGAGVDMPVWTSTETKLSGALAAAKSGLLSSLKSPAVRE